MSGGLQKKQKLATDVFKFGGDRMPWYPLENEPAVDYLYFKAFLDMGVTRTTRVVSGVVGVGVAVLNGLSRSNRWDDRASAYDQHILDIEFRAREDEVRSQGAHWETRRSEIREKAFTNANSLIDKALEMLDYPLESVTETYQDVVEEGSNQVHRTVNVVRSPVRWSMRDAASILKTANELQRLAADLSTNNTKVTIEDKRVQLTVQLIQAKIGGGLTLDEVKRTMALDGFVQSDIEAAIDHMRTSGLLFQDSHKRLSTGVIDVHATEVSSSEE